MATTTDDDDASKKATLKMQKKEYQHEKKRVAKELVMALQDPTVVMMADWIKVRGTLRKWTRFYCVIKPGLFIIYKSPKTNKHGQWVGTVLLNTCDLIERPSKKDGFCFKLYHPLDQSLWATRGPLGESLGAVTQPLPGSYLICRAASEEAGRCWMDALELSLRCTGLLLRTMHKLQQHDAAPVPVEPPASRESDSWSVDGDLANAVVNGASAVRNISETEAERHFDGLDDKDAAAASDSDVDDADEPNFYVESASEQMGALGDSEQTEEIADENKSLVWMLLKQVRPGMDLSKVVLPTFILEPRSFLEKLADYFYHADLLTEAIAEEDPYRRMLCIVKFYLSGFYKKPRGLKKPYNPILGETFRCNWHHPDGSITYYVAEQVSHHPPISAIFVSNRRAGFNISATIFAKSKFYGNSLSAMMNGAFKITLLNRGETYTLTLPYAYCKGLIIGTLTMELGGSVNITCDRTSYTCQLEFKLKPFIGGSMNVVTGKVKVGKETLTEIDGHWDGDIYCTEKDDGRKAILWKPTPDVIKRRLRRFEISTDKLNPFESRRLWQLVTAAIELEDQIVATEQKTVLENAQRERAKSTIVHKPAYFELDPFTHQYHYRYADFRPWDPHNDLRQVEHNYVIRTISKHKTRAVKSTSRSSSVFHQEEDAAAVGSDDSSEDGASDQRKSNRRPIAPISSLHDPTSVHQTLHRIEGQLAHLSARIDHCNDEQSSGNGLKWCFIVAIFAVLQAVLLAYLLRRN